VVAGLPKFGLTAGGADIAFAGDVPQGGGLSSSASLAVALGLALAGDQADRQALAKTAQWSEHHYVGCACGIMDQLASASCVAGHALLIDCRSLATRAVPMPDDAAVMIVHSGVSRELADSAYNERRAQCEAAARHYEVAALRDLDLADLEARRTGLDDIAFARARHVVTENARALAAADSLARGDLQALGTAMYASHVSLRDDFQVSVPAVDALVDVMANAIGPHGGARMTGGGFGGFVVAIVARSRMADVRDALAGHWAALGVAPPLALEVEASAGAYLVDAERPFAR
jgi:galactokinase